MRAEKIPLKIEGAWVVSLDVFSDLRGSFEVFWESELADQLDLSFKPDNVHHSYNAKAGTVRAFHYQSSPYEQAKLVSCVSGRVWDVVVDLREGSPTLHQWDSVELFPGDGKSVYIPEGCAHGFATLEDNSTIAYLIENSFVPNASSVIRWNDPLLNVSWPVDRPILSDRDREAPFISS